MIITHNLSKHLFKNKNADAQSKYSEGHKESLKVKTNPQFTNSQIQNSQIQNSQSFRDSFPMKIRKNRNLRKTGKTENQENHAAAWMGLNSYGYLGFLEKNLCAYISAILQ